MRHLSRRAVLQGGAWAGVLGLLAEAGCSTTETPAPVPVPDGDRPIEKKTLHFSLDHLRADVDHVLEIGHARYPLTRHDSSSLERSRQDNAALRAVPDHELTHFVADAAFVADMPQSFLVTHGVAGSELRGISLAGIHVPTSGITEAATIKGASFSLTGAKRQRLGIAARMPAGGGLHALACADGTTVGEITDLEQFVDEYDAARYLVYHHPDVISLEKTTAALLLHHLDCVAGLDALANQIADLGAAVGPDASLGFTAWARGAYTKDPEGKLVPQTTEDGKPIVIDGKPQYQWHYTLDPAVLEKLGPVVEAALRAVRDDKDLVGRRYHLAQTRTTRDAPLPDPPAPRAPGAESPYKWSTLNENWYAGQRVSGLTVDAAGKKATFTVANEFNRHLGVFCAYLDAGGNPLKRADIGAGSGDAIFGISLDTDYARCLGALPAPPLILGNKAREYEDQTFEVDIPAAASRLAILTGTLAFDNGDFRPEYRRVPTVGAALTVVMEIGIPAISLAYGAIWTYDTWKSLVKELVFPSLRLVGKLGLAIDDSVKGKTADWAGIGIWFANQVLQLALSTGTTFALLWARAITLGQVTKGIPVFGSAIFAIQAADTGLGLLRTSIDLAHSRLVTKTELSSTNPVRVKVKAKDSLGFPQTGKRWEVILTPAGGDTFKQEGDFDFLQTPGEFEVTFPAVPSRGRVAFAARIRTETKWVAGIAEGSFENTVDVAGGKTEVAVLAEVVNQPFPLKPETKYVADTRLEVADDGTRHLWTRVTDGSKPPVGAAVSCEGASEKLCGAVAIGLNAKVAQVGYAWNAAEATLHECGTASGGTSLHTMQNLNLDVFRDAGAPDANIKRAACGTLAPVLPLYPLEGDGAYVLEASTGAYVLRPFDLAGAASDADFVRGRILGRVNSRRIRAAAVLRDEYVLVVSGDDAVDKLELLDLRNKAASDASAPYGTLCSGAGTLLGNIRGAVAVAPTYDTDAFVVLENGNKRLQAFGTTGEPVGDFFVHASGSTAFLDLPKDRLYLDLSVERKNGFVYVLSQVGDGSKVDDFVLDIYDRKKPSAPFATTTGFAAGRFTLDTNQNAISVGWNVLTYRGRREPGLWRWVPRNPS